MKLSVCNSKTIKYRINVHVKFKNIIRNQAINLLNFLGVFRNVMKTQISSRKKELCYVDDRVKNPVSVALGYGATNKFAFGIVDCFQTNKYNYILIKIRRYN
jgi:hypothetical protein